MLVASHVLEALDESRKRSLRFVVVHDEVLPGEGQHPLDDHVVDRHGLDQRLGILRFGGEAIGALLQHLVEEPAEVVIQVLRGLREHLGEAIGLEHAHLAVETLEEAHVAGLVGDLRAEEDPLVLGGSGAHDRPQLLGDLLLADEERGEAIHALETLFLD